MKTEQLTKSNNINNSIQHKKSKVKMEKVLSAIRRDRFLYLLALPGILFFIVFKYYPMYGLVIAFQDYSPFLGILNSPWVGFEHFIRLFTHAEFGLLLRNTLAISFLNIALFFPVPIVIAILLNEIKGKKYKSIIQTAIYFPHFLSWVIIAGISYIMLGQTDGVVNQIITMFGGEKISFLSNPKLFWLMLTGQNIWKECGWGTILFLASITAIDPSLYEAAMMDGANRLQQIWHITLPAIKTVIVILLILRIGHAMDTGFEQVYLMTNATVAGVADVFDTYVYRNGVRNAQFSYATAVGLFKSAIGFLLVVIANKVAKILGEEGVY
ncbi:sugar ABC transporter permease [Clostridium bowmanii]|uniref:ABC transporter permease n=1 Tax=Clostridium bowmanii TaxID=132925 RepID=UPI001C0CFDC0|nr:sugar ABC transporter permease [Clostridium bowmanii]MBU3191013.1 sugar ABC transporter permease [Clostridium bowmanii]MCA1075335.1 sugar ABC transporter permease [Clostridium bowmanii]